MSYTEIREEKRPGRGRDLLITWGSDSAWYDCGGRMAIEEREREVLRGTRRGQSANDLARALRVSTRTIIRIRARLRARGDL